MTAYRFHWWSPDGTPALTPRVSLRAESRLHGAALALRQFVRLGYDATAPLAHIDVSESHGSRQTLLVEEVLRWLRDPKQSDFIVREGLAPVVGVSPMETTVKRQP